MVTQSASVDRAVPILPGPPPSIRERERISFERGGPAEFGSDDGQMGRAWDNLSQSWTAPTSRENVAYMLRIVLLKCSACNYTSNGEEHTIASHINQTLEQVEAHEGATYSDSVGDDAPSKVCSACGNKFMLRKRQHEQHRDVYAGKVGKAHQNAEAEYIKAYSMAPPATVDTPVNGYVKGLSATVPLAAEIGSSRRSSGKRRRGHRGGRRH